MSKTVPFQTIQFSISTQFKCKYSLIVKNLSMSNNSVCSLFYLTLSGAPTPGQSGPGSNGNEGELRIPQSPSITGILPSDCLVS